MSTAGPIRIPTRVDWAVALGIFLAAVLLMTVVAKGAPPTRAGALAAAAIAGISTFAISAWSIRFAVHPRWAYWGSAAALTACAVGAAALLPDLAAWREDMISTLWMHPWYPLVMTTVAASPRARACPAGARGGWLMIGAAAVLGAIGPGIAWLFG